MISVSLGAHITTDLVASCSNATWRTLQATALLLEAARQEWHCVAHLRLLLLQLGLDGGHAGLVLLALELEVVGPLLELSIEPVLRFGKGKLAFQQCDRTWWAWSRPRGCPGSTPSARRLGRVWCLTLARLLRVHVRFGFGIFPGAPYSHHSVH